MDKTVTICFTNNKGGSGKSTTCSNLEGGRHGACRQKSTSGGWGYAAESVAWPFFPED